MAIGIAEACI